MSPVRWEPDDPRWLSTSDLRVMDANVLRQVGIPEAIIVLATRDVLVDSARSEREGVFLASGIPFDDVDDEPYWQDETVEPCRHRRRW